MIDFSHNFYYRALDFATKAHAGQTRKKSGAPYVTHPMRVATLLALSNVLNGPLRSKKIVIKAALLHDVVEDTEYTVEDIRKEFGYSVAHLVKSLTKLPSESKEAYVRRCIQNSFDSCLIKIADRIDNLNEAKSSFSPEKLQKYLESSEFIYAVAADTWREDFLTTDLAQSLNVHIQLVKSSI
ncbi:MAG: HD domain-containing protein [Okeania sp. SIO3H1]|nr:HD domain-containing protein [Okeania sp. SIO3H1]